MNKTPDPGEVVRDKVIPAAEELVASLAERVGPFAKEAVDQVTPVAHAAAEKTVALAHVAAELVAPLSHQAVDAVTPLAQQTRDAVTPYAQQAADAVSPYAAQVAPFAQQAVDRVGPLAQQAAGAVGPYAALLVEQGRKSSHDLAERLEPALGAARDAFSGARDRVTAEYIPAVGAAAATAAASASPLVGAAADRGKALVHGVRSEPVVVVPPPRKKRGWLATLAVVAAAAGATYVVVRKLVGDKGSQWQTARPTTPYVPPTSAQAAAAATTTSDAETDQQTGPSAHDVYRAADGAAEPDQPVEGGDPESDIESDTGSDTGTRTDVVASTTSQYGTVGSADAGSDADAPVDDTDASAIAARTDRVDEVADVDEGADASPAAGQTSGTWGEGSATGSSSAGAAGAAPDSPSSGPDASSPYDDEKVDRELETVGDRAYEEPGDAVWAEQDTAAGGGPATHPDRYDQPGAYVGVEPPEGFTIKGNERSMKYHLPDSNSYSRTIAEVWFTTEEAAQEAGFTRAGH